MDINELLKFSEKDIDALPDDPVLLKSIIKALFAYVIPEIQRLKEENQKLRDEINLLKGEKGKPHFKKPKNKENKTLAELRNEKPEKKERTKSSKKDRDIKVHERKKISVEKNDCPRCGNHLWNNGSEKIIIQDIIFKVHNIEYELEGKRCSNVDCGYTVRAGLPDDLKDQEFGNEVRMLVPFLHFGYGLSHEQLEELLTSIGLVISIGTINNWIQEAGSKCIDVSKEVFESHLKTGNKAFNTDVTGWKTKGKDKQLHVVSNPDMTYYSIRDKYNSAEVNDLFKSANRKDGKLEIYLMTDDHSSYSPNLVKTLGNQLCWIHELRHYKKLIPFLEEDKMEGLKVLDELWGLYRDIQGYREQNKEYNEESAKTIEKKFDEVLSQKVNWETLGHRLSLSIKKKDRLLLCLKFPFLEPNNNRAERDIRPIVVARKKSYGTRSKEGERHFASARSIIGTLKKLGKNVYTSFKNIIRGSMTSQDLIPPKIDLSHSN